MPSYDFICERCGYREERMVSILYPKVSRCPNCEELALIRCIGGGAGFSISGGGVYNSGFHGHKKTGGDSEGKSVSL